jgi:Tfp pilus assembly protein PilF
MKKTVIALFLITAQPCFAQDCKTLALNKPSVTVRTPNVTIRPGDGSKVSITPAAINPRLAKAESWVKGLLNNFTGAKLSYSNTHLFDHTSGFGKSLYNATGIKGYYYSQMRFFAYYCAENKITTEGESGSSIMVYFNNFLDGYGAHSLCSDADLFTINGKPVFKIYEKTSTRGRVDFYERMWQTDVRDTLYGSKDDFILIRNSDQPVFIPITRKELLPQLLKDIDANAATRISFARSMYDPKNESANKAAFDAELKRIDNSKNYTKEQMAPYRKRLIETWETEQQKLDKEVKRVEADTKGAKEVVSKYMKRPAQWLGRTVQDFYSGSVYTAISLRSYFENLDAVHHTSKEETNTELVSLNPAYYNRSLSPDVPQLILVQLAKGNYPHMKKVAGLVRQPGALAPLEALLNGKSTALEPTQPLLTSSYKLIFLPKLNTITPLTVPADIKLSTIPVIPFNNPSAAGSLPVAVPARSTKLGELSGQILTAETYKNYVQALSLKIGVALSPAEKQKADEFLKNKKLSSSKGISNTALAAWLQKSPKASLYLYSKAVVANTADALAANNFAAFLIMGGLPEKAVPVLEYWNKQRPAKSTILANLGNAYYRLGDMTTAMKWLQQAVQQDTLNPVANKLLCMLYLKNGDTKKAQDHGTRSIATCHDEEVIAILRQLNNRIKPGEVMSRFPLLPAKEFPMLERIKMPAMPSQLDDMEQFEIELNAIKASLRMTIADIENKAPNPGGDVQQQLLMASLKKGISPMRIKAQYIIMDGMQIYQAEKVKESDVFRYHVKKINVLFNTATKAIQNKYNNQMKNLEGGEGGDEDVIAALELAKCKALNGETEIYLAGLSRLVNQYAARQEYISRKFFRDYANWAPYWVPATTVSFPSIERDYLKEVLNILGEYKVVKKTNCEIFEPLPIKEGELQKWEDEYCANFKGKIGIGPAKVVWNCNSWAVEAGEGIVGGIGMNYKDDGTFEDFYCELGLGVSWEMGEEHIAKVAAGATVKEFVKIGPNDETGEWAVKDAGVKGEIAIEQEIGNVGAELKVIEITAGYRSGITKEGLAVPLLDLK